MLLSKSPAEVIWNATGPHIICSVNANAFQQEFVPDKDITLIFINVFIRSNSFILITVSKDAMWKEDAQYFFSQLKSLDLVLLHGRIAQD